MNLDTPFENFLVGLVRAEVRFILVGGLAVSLNGYVRVTEDVDILLDYNPANIEKLIRFLENYGECNASGLRWEDFADEEGTVRVEEEFTIDLFVRMKGKNYTDLLPQTLETRLAEWPLRYLNKEALIELKSGSYRPKDQMDVHALQQLLRNPRAFEV